MKGSGRGFRESFLSRLRSHVSAAAAPTMLQHRVAYLAIGLKLFPVVVLELLSPTVPVPRRWDLPFLRYKHLKIGYSAPGGQLYNF